MSNLVLEINSEKDYQTLKAMQGEFLIRAEKEILGLDFSDKKMAEDFQNGTNSIHEKMAEYQNHARLLFLTYFIMFLADNPNYDLAWQRFKDQYNELKLFFNLCEPIEEIIKGE